MIIHKIDDRGDFIDDERVERDCIKYEHELANENLSYALALLPDHMRAERIRRENEILSGWTEEEREEFYRKWGR